MYSKAIRTVNIRLYICCCVDILFCFGVATTNKPLLKGQLCGRACRYGRKKSFIYCFLVVPDLFRCVLYIISVSLSVKFVFTIWLERCVWFYFQYIKYLTLLIHTYLLRNKRVPINLFTNSFMDVWLKLVNTWKCLPNKEQD